MQSYAYTLLESSGRKKNGVIEASSKEAAIQKLAAEGQFVLSVEAASGQSNISGPAEQEKRSKSVSKSDLALFTRRLADLSSAGLPLDRVLQVVAEQSESSTLANVAEQALEEVRGGIPVSEALSHHPKYFSGVFAQTLRAGEASGQFPEVASRLAEFQETEVARKSTIISALIYPAVLSSAAVSVIVFLMTYVIPKLKDVFTSLGGKLPSSTLALLAISNFLTQNYLILFGSIAGSIFFYRAWVRTDSGALTRDGLLLRLPGIGTVARKATVSRFARVLGTLVYGGVPILEALDLAGKASGNKVFEKGTQQVLQEVREGQTIHQAMRDAGGFPPVLTHMVAIGEETGDLPKMLGRVADSLDFEVDTGLKRLTTLAEPIIVLTMGGVVGFVVLSVLMPIYEAQQLVK